MLEHKYRFCVKNWIKTCPKSKTPKSTTLLLNNILGMPAPTASNPYIFAAIANKRNPGSNAIEEEKHSGPSVHSAPVCKCDNIGPLEPTNLAGNIHLLKYKSVMNCINKSVRWALEIEAGNLIFPCCIGGVGIGVPCTNAGWLPILGPW